MTQRVVLAGVLNRTMLERQLLLRRSRIDVPTALERVGGLQNQYAPSGYVGLWSRLVGFARADLTEALERRRVVQGTLMRATIHLVSSADYPLFAAGIRRSRRDWWLRVQGDAIRGVDMDAAADVVRAALSAGPRRQAELASLLTDSGFPHAAWNGVGMFVDLLRVPPSGTWERRRADIYALADDWLDPSSATEEEGLVHLVRRYVGAFGPAPVVDIANWAGVPAGAVRRIVGSLDMVRYRDEGGRELFDVRDTSLTPAAAAAPPRFLGTWDTMLLAHARRARVMPEEYRPLIFGTKTPQSFPTFLLDGRVAGTWRHLDGEVALEPFSDLAPRERGQLEDEAAGLAALHRN